MGAIWKPVLKTCVLLYAMVLLYTMLFRQISYTSVQRAVGETLFWSVFPIGALTTERLTIAFHMDESLIPDEENDIPLVHHISPEDDPVEIFREAIAKQDRIIVWDDVIDPEDHLANFQDEDFVYNTFNRSDTYDVLTQYTNYKFSKLTLGEFMDQAKVEKNLYMGFSYVLMANNPHYEDAVMDHIETKLPGIVEILNLRNAIQHGFMYWGNRYSTGSHQAPVDDVFLQISGAKTWRFVKPKYTPFMKPFLANARCSLMSGTPYIPNDSRIPYVDVTSKKGSILYFPAHYWHEVHNVDPEDGFALASGFRPKSSFLSPKHIALPFLAPTGMFFHKFALPFGLAGNIINVIQQSKLFTGGDSGAASGLQVRINTIVALRDFIQSYYPGFSWDKWAWDSPHKDNIHTPGYIPGKDEL